MFKIETPFCFCILPRHTDFNLLSKDITIECSFSNERTCIFNIVKFKFSAHFRGKNQSLKPGIVEIAVVTIMFKLGCEHSTGEGVQR